MRDPLLLAKLTILTFTYIVTIMRMTNMRKGSSGCWTCRIRRKKCDEQHPICKECRTLRISTCSYGDRPVWMDGGVKQEAMAERVKNEIKRQAPYRPRRKLESSTRLTPEVSTLELDHPKETTSLGHSPSATPAGTSEAVSSISIEDVCKQVLRMRPFAQADSVLLLFYLERLLPFLFPFYRPSPLQGSRAWILDLVICSPVVRQAILCQSSFFFTLADAVSIPINSQMWEALLEQARGAFNMLRGTIQVIESTTDNESIFGSVRAMAAIVQLQRFETAISCFDNCRAHLNAALTVFHKIINVVGTADLASSSIKYRTILSLLGPQTWILSTREAQVPSSEQAAFGFSLALLLFDDVIASTILQERPQLYDYHHSFLCKCGGIDGAPCVNLEALLGCQNWVIRQIGEIAALDAWRKSCKAACNLDVLELAHHAAAIKKALEAHILQLENERESISQRSNLEDDTFTADDLYGQSRSIARQSSLVTQIWAHSAFLYLSVIISGWQPANAEVRRNVTQALELLTHNRLPPAVLRSMAWPICMVGCLTEPTQQGRIRNMVGSLQPASRFSTVCRGFDIIEKVWNDRAAGTEKEFAQYFRDESTLVLLV